MIQNYYKTLIRNLTKNKGFTFINILGLSIGMAAALLIVLWVQHENSIDKFHENIDRLYAVYNRENNGKDKWVNNSIPQILGKVLSEEYPEVEEMTKVNYKSIQLSVADKKLSSLGLIVDSTFLNLFTFPLIKGQKQQVLNDPNHVVITESLAEKLFEKVDPIGKTIKVDSATQFIVSGVLKDLPNNTNFKFDFLIPWSYGKKLGWQNNNWGANSTTTYITLKKGTSVIDFENKIKNITKDHTKNDPMPINPEVFLHPVAKKHLYNKDVSGYLITGNIQKIQLFTVIACLILLIACINFMNLSTAKSEKRAKEVGVRKVVGVRKSGLILQFIFESTFLSLISFVIAIILIQLSLPMYEKIVGSTLKIPFQEPIFWLFSLSFVLLTGLLAGSYPAFFLSSFNPIKVLKGTFRTSKNGIKARKVLVVFQFTIAITLIISTIIIYKQIQFGLAREVGYDRSQLIYLNAEGNIKKQYQTIKNELLNSGAVRSVSLNRAPITERWSDQWGLEWEGSTDQDAQISFITMGSNSDLVKTMGFELISGRDIDIEKFATDSNAAVLNEAAIKAMGLKDPIGKMINHKGYPDENYHIVGVVKDFVLESPFMDKINPVLISGPSTYFANTVHIRLSDQYDTKSSLEKIEKIFTKFNPEYTFNYNFVDQSFAWKFIATQRTAKLISLFSGLTILISCLGLFGLAAYMAENRTKEIGVRKVFGASSLQVIGLLSKEFLFLSGLAFIISSPIAWYTMHEWLKDYSYNAGISWWVFLFTGISIACITLITVFWQSIKAANANPIKSLRTE